MRYKVLMHFCDLQDERHEYRAGDEFPRPGLKVSKQRIAELISNKNKRGVPLITEIPEEITEEDPVEEEKPKKKGKKKNA